MKKIGNVLLSFIVLLLVSCSSDSVPPLAGNYESRDTQGDGIFVHMAIQPEEKTFVEYISNREVDRGTYEEKSDNVYLFKGEKQEFEITLSPEDSFYVTVHQLNEGKPIELKNTGNIPTYFSTEYDNVEEYEKLLHENEEE